MRKAMHMILLALLLAIPLAAKDIEEEKLEATPGGLLEVDLETGGSLEITGWGEPFVLVRARPTGGAGDDQEIIIEKTDEGVRIEAESTKGWGRHHRSGGYDVEINVPSVYDLELETMGGSITVSNVEGDLEGETMGGDIRLSGLKGHIEFETMGGSITLENSEVDGEIETMGGEVIVENVVGDVDGSSMGGKVIYKNVTRRSGGATGKAVIISTMGGEIEIESAPAGAKLETMGGEIIVGSAGKFVEAETMGGDIVIGSVDGWVKAETMGGDVKVTLVGDPQAGDRDIKLSSMGGEIHLTVPRNFSMNVDVEISYDAKSKRVPEIVSDFPLTIEKSEGETSFWRGRGSAVRGSGSFNGGTNTVEIETVGGNVYLKQAG
ncbi:MAG: DUF4097 family beta strand repeat-containing protein [Acidobacteriota bacterium]|nr:DUF4097 family beta strand repeat-containing protein [Acidobacteriota bacterium]